MPKSPKAYVSVAFISGLCATIGHGAFAASCPSANAQLAMDAQDLRSMETIYEDVQFNADCSNKLRQDMRDTLATQYFNAAKRTSGDQRLAHLEDALKFGRSWTYEAALGEELLAQRAFDRAAVHLQKAINRLNDNPTEGTISEDETQRLVRLASTAMGLADGPIEVPMARNGNVGGIFTGSIRGFKITEVDVHVTFEFDSDAFTEEGRRMADQFARALVQQGPADIVLEGHTDPQGSEAYNLELSQKRAETMRAFLTQQGFQGEIKVVPKGETDPPQIEISLSEEERFQLARRVELIRQ